MTLTMTLTTMSTARPTCNRPISCTCRTFRDQANTRMSMRTRWGLMAFAKCERLSIPCTRSSGKREAKIRKDTKIRREEQPSNPKNRKETRRQANAGQNPAKRDDRELTIKKKSLRRRIQMNKKLEFANLKRLSKFVQESRRKRSAIAAIAQVIMIRSKI